MASLTDVLVTMQIVEKYLYQAVTPILILIGTIGCILNLIVFTQKNLRKNPCSIYFIAYNIANLLLIYASLVSLTLDVGYHIDPSAQSIAFCRLRLYVTILLNLLSPFYLILASIDRILVTSPNALIRRRSTLRRAYLCVIGGALFWSLFHAHAVIMANIIQYGPDFFMCYYSLGVYLVIVSDYFIIKEILVLVLMIICGSWAIKNIRSIRQIGTIPTLSVSRSGVETNINSNRSKDRQLLSMLLMDIVIHLLFGFLFAIFLLYQQITEYDIKSVERLQIEIVVRNLTFFSIGIPLCTSCYTNLLISKTFRSEVKKLFRCP